MLLLSHRGVGPMVVPTPMEEEGSIISDYAIMHETHPAVREREYSPGLYNNFPLLEPLFMESCLPL